MAKNIAGQIWTFVATKPIIGLGPVLAVITLLVAVSLFLPSIVLGVTIKNQSGRRVEVSVYPDSESSAKTLALEPGESGRVKLWAGENTDESSARTARFIAVATDDAFRAEASFDGRQLVPATALIIVTADGKLLLQQQND